MKTKAIYTGSFDPLTNGHMDIITRAAGFCDELTVGIISNPSKTPLFSIEDREQMIAEATEHLPGVRVDHFSGLLADYVNENGYNLVIRGLRCAADFEYEIQMAHMNDKLFREHTETIFLMTDPQYSYVSSSVIKEVHSLGGSIEGLVPDAILKRMNEALIK